MPCRPCKDDKTILREWALRSARLFFAKTAAFYLSSDLRSNRSFISRILPICRLE